MRGGHEPPVEVGLALSAEVVRDRLAVAVEREVDGDGASVVDPHAVPPVGVRLPVPHDATGRGDQVLEEGVVRGQVQVAVGVHPTGERHRRTVVDLQVLLVKHAELEQGDRLRVDGDHRVGAIGPRVVGVHRDVELLVEAEQSGIRAARDRLRDRRADARATDADRESRDGRGGESRELGVRDGAVLDVGLELRHDVIGAGLGRVGGPSAAIVHARPALHHERGREAGADEHRQQDQHDERRLEGEARPARDPCPSLDRHDVLQAAGLSRRDPWLCVPPSPAGCSGLELWLGSELPSQYATKCRSVTCSTCDQRTSPRNS